MNLSTDTGAVVLDVLAGLGILFIGVGVLVLCLRAGGLLTRLQRTLDGVDRQVGTLSAPIATTLTHIGGIADTADTTIARLGAVVVQLENVAATATKTVGVIGATITGGRKSARPDETAL